MGNDVPEVPSWFIFVRYAQIVLNFIVLVCAAVAIGAFDHAVGGAYAVGWGPGFAIFTSVYVLLFLVALFLVPIKWPQFYYKWIILIAEAFACLWTLISFAGMAEWATAFSWPGFDSDFNTIHGATSAGAAFGAFLWVTFIVTMVFYGLGCYRSRQARQTYGNSEAAMGPVPAPPAPQQPYGYQA